MPDPTFSEREKTKHMDQEIREMIAALTGRLTTLQHVHKAGGGSSQEHEDEESHAARIITLAGNNMGASLRGEVDEKAGVEAAESEAMKAFVNSNFQAINNSIMLGGSYSSNDPGVHMEVVDNLEEPQPHPQMQHGKKKKKLGKKKGKESSSSSDQKNDNNSD